MISRIYGESFRYACQSKTINESKEEELCVPFGLPFVKHTNYCVRQK